MKRKAVQAAEKAKVKRGGNRKRSRYATKVARGNQMYGPGCCAHAKKGGRNDDGASRSEA